MRRSRRSSDAMASLRSTRLRGGFLASALPGNPGLSSGATGAGLSTQSGPSQLPTAEMSTSRSVSPQDSFTLETDHVAALNSIMRLCKFMQEKSISIERRVLSIEEKQAKLSDTLKELHVLMKKHIKDSFAIKGSSFEVIVAMNIFRLY